MPDVEIARAMMRSAVPLEVSDEAIKNTCHYIGNVLNNKAQDLARDINYVPKRRTRASHNSISTPVVDPAHSSTAENATQQTRPKDPERDHTTVPSGISGSVPATPQGTHSALTPQTDGSSATHMSHGPNHCIYQCKHPENDQIPMVRCCLCYKWHHEDCVSDIYSPKSDNWWICALCRQSTATTQVMSRTLQQIQQTLNSLVKMNFDLFAKVEALTESNRILSAKVDSMSNSQCKCKDNLVQNPEHHKLPTLLIGDSTIRDVIAKEKDTIRITARGGGKTNDILSMLKKMTTKSFADVIVHVGTNDTSTKFPTDKIIENMSQIMDTAKHISVTGHVTISGICPRTDNSDAALKGNDVCDRVQQICADKGCIFVDHRDTFLTRNGDTIEELLLIDGLHLSSPGTKKTASESEVIVHDLL